MITVAEGPSLQVRALRALLEEVADDERYGVARLRAWKASHGLLLQEWLAYHQIVDSWPLGTQLSDSSISIEGIIFEIAHDTYQCDHIGIRGACPRCGEDCLSAEVTNLASLGKMLSNFKPAWWHWKDCRAAKPEPPAMTRAEHIASTLQLLLDLLRQGDD